MECISFFLLDSSFAKLDSSGILKKALNRRTNLISKLSDIQQPVRTSDSADAKDSQPNELIIARSAKHLNSNVGDQEVVLKEFMGVVATLRSLIDDFRANRLTYKDFSTKLDDLFETLDKQYRFLEQLQLSRMETDTRLKTAERMLKSESALKDRIKADLANSMIKLESIINKTKQIA